MIDGADNFPTRYLVNDGCVKHGRPNVHGSVHRFEGQVAVFHPGHGPCYRCLYPAPPPAELAPSCAEAGVLGVLPGLVGVLQATETLKILLGLGDAPRGRLLYLDVLAPRFRLARLPRDPGCPVCSGPSRATPTRRAPPAPPRDPHDALALLIVALLAPPPRPRRPRAPAVTVVAIGAGTGPRIAPS
ncbi:MAG: ThiF family adenylyltransferase [bacterium]